MCVHGMFGATAFDQLWYVQERGYDRALIAQTTGWFGVAGGVLGNLIGGIGSDYWKRITGKSRLSFSGLGANSSCADKYLLPYHRSRFLLFLAGRVFYFFSAWRSIRTFLCHASGTGAAAYLLDSSGFQYSDGECHWCRHVDNGQRLPYRLFNRSR